MILQFFEKGFVLQKICSNAKLLKTFKVSSDSQTNGHFENPYTGSVFRKAYALFIGCKMKPLRKSVFLW